MLFDQLVALETLMSKRVVVLTLALVAALPRLSSAQDTPLSEILVNLIQTEIRLAGPPPGSPFQSHDAHFIPGVDQKLAPYIFNQAIVTQLSTYPLGSSAGGFSYSFDPGLGTYKRSTNSFGPAFAERAVTVGRKRGTIGANYQHASYDSFEGKDIGNGDIKFYLTHLMESGAFFEGDLVGTALTMDLSTDTFSFFGTYGLTDRFDVGIAVPVMHVSLDAKIDATVIRLATLESGPTSTIHTFPGGANTNPYTDSGSATGIGDILLRAKYRLFDMPGGGIAAAFDLRTPTGDADNLLGTGATQGKLLFVVSNEFNKLSPHVNIGYTFSGDSSNQFVNVTDEFNYAFGTEYTPSPKVTITGDVIGRSLRDSGRLVEQPHVFNWRTAAGQTGTTTFNEFASVAGSLNLVLGAAGVKFNPKGNLLISANVLFPLTDAGIRAKAVPVIGFDYAF